MKRYLVLISSLFLSATAWGTSGGQVNIGMIAADVAQAAVKDPVGNFLNWKITGACIWEHWTIFGPYLTKTWRVNEFLPDTIVTVFNRVGEDPLLYSNSVLDPILKGIGDQIAKSAVDLKPIAGGDDASSHNDGTMQFKEVDVIGDPMARYVGNIFPSAMIPSVSTPYMPYYSSLLDSLEWRDPKVDLVMAAKDIALYTTTIGSTDQWGSLYPRNGFVVQPGDYKTAAVDALRASDIATVSGTGHMYHGLLTGSCGDECTIEPNSETDINDFSEAKYQEIYPKSSIDAHDEFGSEDPPKSTYGQDQLNKGKGDYIWVMWRHYHGCIQDSGRLFQVIKF